MDQHKLKLTPWFPVDVKPARVGVYERRYGGSIAYSRWDGSRWMGGSFDIYIARRTRHMSRLPRLPWRGLAEKPQ